MKSEVKHVVAVCSTKIRYYYERGPWGSEVDPALGRGRGDLSLTNCSIRFRSIMGTYLKLFYNGHYCGGGAGAGCGVWSWCWCWCQSTETLIVFSKQSVTRWRESPSLPALETIILGILLYCLEVGELFALSQSEGWDVSRQGGLGSMNPTTAANVNCCNVIMIPPHFIQLKPRSEHSNRQIFYLPPKYFSLVREPFQLFCSTCVFCGLLTWICRGCNQPSNMKQ